MDPARAGAHRVQQEGDEMPEHRTGTREEWQAARDELARLEAEQAERKDGLRENPGWIAFARENGTIYHTYTVTAPDPFVAPYFSFLLERTPKAQPAEPRSWRKDEYPH